MAENSKISVSLFRDLERDDVSRWPSGIFRRSFIRAYAEAVGLDADETTREFLERFPDRLDPDFGTAPSTKSSLRLTLADTGTPFMRGRLLASARSRWPAIACDATIIAIMGFAIDAVFGTLWMPLCLTLIGYYAGGILLLGNTPGACVGASFGGTYDPPSGFKVWRRLWPHMVEILPALRPKSRYPARVDCREWPSPEDQALSKL